MLLINFFKKASRLLVCKKKNVLMLFLCSKPSLFILVSSLFLNSSNAINVFQKNNTDDFHLRILKANQYLETQESNFSIYIAISIILITLLTIFTIIYLNRHKNQIYKNNVQLREVLADQKNLGFQQRQKIKLFSKLIVSFGFRLNQIKESINNLCVEFSVSDSKLNSEIGKINEFSKEMGLLYSKSITIIKKL